MKDLDMEAFLTQFNKEHNTSVSVCDKRKKLEATITLLTDQLLSKEGLRLQKEAVRSGDLTNEHFGYGNGRNSGD